MSETKKRLLEFVLNYRELLAITGQIKFGVDATEAKKVSADYVWTLVDYDDGDLGKTIIVNAFEESDERFGSVLDYGIAENPYPQGEDIAIMPEVVWIYCPVCEGGDLADPDECERCEQNGTLFLDIEVVAKDGPKELTEDYVWNQLQSS